MAAGVVTPAFSTRVKLRRPLKHPTVGTRWQRAIDEIPLANESKGPAISKASAKRRCAASHGPFATQASLISSVRSTCLQPFQGLINGFNAGRKPSGRSIMATGRPNAARRLILTYCVPPALRKTSQSISKRSNSAISSSTPKGGWPKTYSPFGKGKASGTSI